MGRRAATVLFVAVAASRVLGQTPVGATQDQAQANWVVSVMHSVHTDKLLERYRAHPDVRAGVIGNAPAVALNITTGLVIDSDGHIITRLVNLDPKESNPALLVTTAEGSKHQARLVGVDCPTGFAVLKVDSLSARQPAQFAAVADGAAVKILSISPTKRSKYASARIQLEPAIATADGTVRTGNAYSRLRGALTLRSERLLSRNDSSVVTTQDGKLVGMAQFSGVGRAYLYPADFIRNTVLKRVVEKKGTVPAAWLGVKINQSPAQQPPLQFSGVLVTEVQPNSPAAKCGLRPNDVIVAFDDVEVRGITELSTVLSASPAGRKVKLRALREKQPLLVEVELGERECEQPGFAFGLEDQIGASLEEQLRRLDERRVDLEILALSYNTIPESAWAERNEALREIHLEIEKVSRQKLDLQQQVHGLADNDATQRRRTRHSLNVTAFPAGFQAMASPPQLTGRLTGSTGRGEALLVWEVETRSPAESSGLRAGDLILGTDQSEMSASDLKIILLRQREALTLRVIRDKAPILINLAAPNPRVRALK